VGSDSAFRLVRRALYWALGPEDALRLLLKGLVQRTGIDPAGIGQVVGGCVGQVGTQSMNIMCCGGGLGTGALVRRG
jgi:acetyl-CoA acetyltransferase